MFGIAALAASFLTTGPASASFASQIAQLQAQQAALLQQLNSLQGQASSAGQQAAATQTQINTVQATLTQDETELSQVNANLAETKDQLVATQAQMAKDRTELADLVTVLYQRNGSDSFAAAIANSSSISKIVDDTVDLQTVRQQFDSLTKQLIADANALKRLQAQQQTQEQQVATLVTSVQGQENQLQTQENAFSAEENSLTGQAGTIAAQVQQISSQIVMLQAEADASEDGNGVGSGGQIVSTCRPNSSNPCYTGPDLYEDSYTPVGQCTWFVATQAYIPWHGNAEDWYGDDVHANTYPTGSTPRVNSIVVFDPGGYYSDLGHVAWVIAVGLGPTGAEFEVEEDNVVDEGSGTQDRRIVPNTEGVMQFLYPSN
ncbi:MAG: CHAP domain-containing protein [Candidatus Dormiibacterota bacterium]